MPGLRDTVLAYMAAVTALGHRLMEGVALSLALPADYFAARYTADPLILFRLFNYRSQPVPEGNEAQWGVGEHSDYGLLTILLQDDVGGLQVKTRGGWTAAPPIPGSFVCNIGHMLDRMTGSGWTETFAVRARMTAIRLTGRSTRHALSDRNAWCCGCSPMRVVGMRLE